MTQLPKQYDPKISEAHWQKKWEEMGVYAFRDDKPKAETFVIDTPPPTVSGVLHMGHIFSYTQADFIARYKRMRGFDVFYPMGFDDNGLPTERLVEKLEGVRGSAMPREQFVELCRKVVAGAEDEFRKLFTGVALSVDWKLLYQTVSDRVIALSQASFLDLVSKGECYRDFRPGYWDWVDQTAIATAEIEEKELQGVQITIPFGIMEKSKWDAGERPSFESLAKVHVMTTRPELLGACVALMVHPDDKAKYEGKVAVSPLFNVVVPICFDGKVDKEKGTGFVMCCSWGDDTDKEWIAKHQLAWRPLVQKNGKLSLGSFGRDSGITFVAGKDGINGRSEIDDKNCLDKIKCRRFFDAMHDSKLIRDVKNENSAKGKALKLLEEADLLIPQGEKGEKIIHKMQMVKCAERSGSAIEIIPTSQWFVKLTDKKEALKAKGAEVTWHPQHMKIRLDQWIDGLKEDWCISRQRFFGVPFPVWYVYTGESLLDSILDQKVFQIYPKSLSKAIDPLKDIPAYLEEIPLDENEAIFFEKMKFDEKGYKKVKALESYECPQSSRVLLKKGDVVYLKSDPDVMDTWATSSISPQINAGSVDGRQGTVDKEQMSTVNSPLSTRFSKLFPADLRPQAHEIIRTWAFYTIAKAHLHTNNVPWKNIMISGWCLAADKTKMSKSKGNVVTPVALIEDKGADAVRYWASTSRLATDTAFSEDLLKIGKKLVGKIWNASNLIAQVTVDSGQTSVDKKELSTVHCPPSTIEPLDLWILSRLHVAITKATAAFEQFEYCDARVAIEDFFWNDFCDNYLELVKARAYGQNADNRNAEMQTHGICISAPQQSALLTLHTCLDCLLRLFAPFVPHVTEEIYSHLFSEKGSVHARGQWPVAADVAYDAEAEKAGMAAVEILEIIRKAKSEAGVSIKAPVARVQIFGTDKAAVSFAALAGVMEDLKAAGSVHEMVSAKHGDSLPYLTTSGGYRVSVELAKVEEIKRNSDHAAHEKLEGKVISAPGKPDLSKQVVKLQVNNLATSLERQKS